MNPFNDTKNNIQENFNIKVWTEKRGKKTDTYLTGWIQDKNDLAVHHKQLKKSLGCNGTVKIKKKNDENVLLFHLQGNRIYEIINYLKNNGIEESSVEIIG